MLICTAFGYNTIETAKMLFVSRNTVASHRKHILGKLGAASMTHALTEALLKDELTIQDLKDIKLGVKSI